MSPKAVLEGWAVMRATGAPLGLRIPSWEVPMQLCAKCWLDNLVLALEVVHQLPSITPYRGCVISAKSPPVLASTLHL